MTITRTLRRLAGPGGWVKMADLFAELRAIPREPVMDLDLNA